MDRSEITGYRDDLPEQLKRQIREICYWDYIAEDSIGASARLRAYDFKNYVLAQSLREFPENWWVFSRSPEYVTRPELYSFVSLAGMPSRTPGRNRVVVHAPFKTLEPSGILYDVRDIVKEKIRFHGNRAPKINFEHVHPWPEDPTSPPESLSGEELIAELLEEVKNS